MLMFLLHSFPAAERAILTDIALVSTVPAQGGAGQHQVAVGGGRIVCDPNREPCGDNKLLFFDIFIV